MKSKLVITFLVVSVMITALAGTIGTARAESMCDPDFVTQSGKVFTVTPTGVDDTANIQCAFDAAVAYGPGAEVHLAAGNFHTAQIVVNDFDGAFTGEGPDETVIMNLPNLYVTPVDMQFNPPSADNPWATLIGFMDGNVVISDLAVHVVGDEPTTGWSVWGIDPPIMALSCAVCFWGTTSNVIADNIHIEGEPLPNSMFGYNLFNGISIAGFIGAVPPPISGSFQVYNSSFRTMASGTPVSNVVNTQIIIQHNTFDDVIYGLDGGDLDNSSFEFSHNKVNATIGIDFYNIYLAGDVDSSYLIKNNVFRGAVGPAFEQSFGAGNECLLIGNNVQQVTDIGIFLGPNITNCTVVGGNNKTNVLDLGTGNILTGVNNMGTGVGPAIRSFMRR